MIFIDLSCFRDHFKQKRFCPCQGQTFDVGIGSWQHPAVFCSWIFVSWRQFMISLSKEMLIRMVFQVKCQHSQIIFLQLDLCGFSATGRQTFWDWSLGNFRSFRGTYVLPGRECWICSTSLSICRGSSGPSSPGFRSRDVTCGCAASAAKSPKKKVLLCRFAKGPRQDC